MHILFNYHTSPVIWALLVSRYYRCGNQGLGRLSNLLGIRAAALPPDFGAEVRPAHSHKQAHDLLFSCGSLGIFLILFSFSGYYHRLSDHIYVHHIYMYII